jgi:hypothetical protein
VQCDYFPVFHLLQPHRHSTSEDEAVGDEEQEFEDNDLAINLRIGKFAAKKVHVYAAIKLQGLPVVKKDIYRLRHTWHSLNCIAVWFLAAITRRISICIR